MPVIFIAEDNPADVYLLRESLSLTDPTAVMTVAQDGEEAIEFVEGRGRFTGRPLPDLVVLDLNLPKSDGMEVLRRLRADPQFNTIPVVILSSSDSPADRGLGAALGAESFLTKPADLDLYLNLGGVLLSYVGERRQKPSSKPVRAGGSS